MWTCSLLPVLVGAKGRAWAVNGNGEALVAVPSHDQGDSDQNLFPDTHQTCLTCA